MTSSREAVLWYSASLLSVAAILMLPSLRFGLLMVPLILGFVLLQAFSCHPSRFFLKALWLQPSLICLSLFAAFHDFSWPGFFWFLARANLCLLFALLPTMILGLAGFQVFCRTIHLPSLLESTMLFCLRYLDLLQTESHRMNRARQARTFSDGKFSHWQGLSQLIARLFRRTLERAQRISQAMQARGWSQK